MPEHTPDGMMRTRGGARIAVRPDFHDQPVVIIHTFGIAASLTLDESHALRDLLHDTELRAARGDVIT